MREVIYPVRQKNDIVFMTVSGSFVKGKQSPKSDIDIAIEFDRKSRKTILDLVRIEDPFLINEL